MSLLWTTLAAAIAATLAGCMISEGPLIGPDDADFPFQALSYRQAEGSGATQDTIELVRVGDSYVTVGTEKEENIKLRLKDVGGGLYLAQLSSDEHGKESYIYAVLKVDLNADTAQSYLATAEDAYVTTGISKCDDGNLCIDDLDAYLALAKAQIAAGAKPDAVYAFVGMN